jgi:hypothetical protein
VQYFIPGVPFSSRSNLFSADLIHPKPFAGVPSVNIDSLVELPMLLRDTENAAFS